MRLSPSNITKGGQITAYRFKMFNQVNSWFSFWVLLIFLFASVLGFYKFTSDEILENGVTYEIASSFSSLDSVLGGGKEAKTFHAHIYSNDKLVKSIPMTLSEVINSKEMKAMGDKFMLRLQLFVVFGGGIATAIYVVLMMFIGGVGKKETDDEYISGMTLTDDPKKVNKLLKKNNALSDLKIGDLHLVKNSEIQNICLQGTVGTGKSTVIRYILDYIVSRGDRFVIYDSGGTFIETHYDESRDYILNPHDERCANWNLWEECEDVVDFENFSNSLIPLEGNSDPFWVSSSRTILGDTAMQMSTTQNPTLEEFLKVILSLSLKNLREFLKNTPSANLVEEKIEKTAISIRSVTTNYAKSLRFLQGIDKGQEKFSIRKWMTDEKNSSSGLFISTTSAHRASTKPLISMWLSMATTYLQSMGENRDRRVWFIYDELPSLQKIPDLLGTLAEARKFGGCFILGFQNMSQLTDTYGRDKAKALSDLLNTRLYGRAPSAEIAMEVEKELGNQRRWEAKEQNSFGLDQVRDGISIGRDRVHQAIVDYEEILALPDLCFYTRLPGKYPIIKMDVPYRNLPKKNEALKTRLFKDQLSPLIEKLIVQNERGYLPEYLSESIDTDTKTDVDNTTEKTVNSVSSESPKSSHSQHNFSSSFFDSPKSALTKKEEVKASPIEPKKPKAIERETTISVGSSNTAVNDIGSDPIERLRKIRERKTLAVANTATQSTTSSEDSVSSAQPAAVANTSIPAQPSSEDSVSPVQPAAVANTTTQVTSSGEDSSNSTHAASVVKTKAEATGEVKANSDSANKPANNGVPNRFISMVKKRKNNRSSDGGESESSEQQLNVSIAKIDDELIIKDGNKEVSSNSAIEKMAQEEQNINRPHETKSIEEGEMEL